MNGAALNPIYMASRGLRPLVTLLRVHRWPVMKKRLHDSDIPCYALFGRFDTIVSMYATPALDMALFFTRRGIDESLYSDLTIAFRADRVDRVHGQSIQWPTTIPKYNPLTREDIQAVSALQRSWTAVSDQCRQGLIQRGIILPQPIERDDADDRIHAFVLIRLPVVSASEFEVQRKFLNGTVFRDYSEATPTVMWSEAQMGHHLFVECKTRTVRELVALVMDELHELDPRGFQSETYIALHRLNGVEPTFEEEIDKLPKDIGDTTLQKFQEIANIIDELVSKYYPDEADKLQQVNDRDRLSAVYIFNQIAPVIDAILDLSDDSEITRLSMDARNDIVMAQLLSDIHYVKRVGQQMGSMLEHCCPR